MLHMVVLVHGPETCAAAHKEYGQMARDAMSAKDRVAGKHGASIKGMWVDAPAHTFYFLVDAPSAHAVNDLMVDLKFFLWNGVDVHPIVPLEDAMKLAA
jgi:muconolactone delta-isomerase